MGIYTMGQQVVFHIGSTMGDHFVRDSSAGLGGAILEKQAQGIHMDGALHALRLRPPRHA
jgi:hypothetical protein